MTGLGGSRFADACPFKPLAKFPKFLMTHTQHMLHFRGGNKKQWEGCFALSFALMLTAVKSD